MIRNVILLVLGLLFHCYALQSGEIPPEVTLEGKTGGRLNGSAWSSDELKGQVSIVFYVDPDKRHLNDHAARAIQTSNLPADSTKSFAIINLDATWIPHFILNRGIKREQKKFPLTTFIKDDHKTLVDKWKLNGNSNTVIIFDKKGRVAFYKEGKLSSVEVSQMVSILGKLIYSQ